MSILQEKQKCGSFAHTTYALRDRISSPVLATLEDGFFVLLHIIEDYNLSDLLHLNKCNPTGS